MIGSWWLREGGICGSLGTTRHFGLDFILDRRSDVVLSDQSAGHDLPWSVAAEDFSSKSRLLYIDQLLVVCQLAAFLHRMPSLIELPLANTLHTLL